MQLQISRVEGGYLAKVTPSHGDDASWVADQPMNVSDLVAKLRALGFHQQDIGDAFYEADPDWLTRADE